MTYDQTRDDEELHLLQPSMQRFVNQYRRDRPTIILLPGGMASALLQADQAYSGGSGPFSYQTAWLPPRIFWGGAPRLQMTGDLDWQDHITIALDTIGFAGVTPYSGFQLWCSLHPHEFNWFIFGWDWRRRLEHTVDFLEQTFLPALRSAVQQEHGAGIDPLEGCTLIGHSFGGLVLKLFLMRGGPLVDGLARAITVGTPFYGYGGSKHFYFAGMEPLNPFYGKREMASIIGSMQGPYALFFLDLATYQQNQAALANDPYPLSAYPSLDSANANLEADPYNPKRNGHQMRYPDGGWFDELGELKHAQLIRAQIAAPLPPAVNAKFFNIRAVQKDPFGRVLAATIWSQTWKWINPGFDPNTDGDPICSFNGPGDDTVPAWSARLLSTPKDNVITLEGLVEHMTLMDNPIMLQHLPHGPESVAERLSHQLGPERRQAASSSALRDFLQGVSAASNSGGRAAALTFLGQKEPEELRRLARRFLADLLKPAS